MKLVILLSTYNGTLYLEDFLTSLEKQTYQNWELIVRDDASSDDTLVILQKFSDKINKVSILKDRQNLGVKKSFSTLVNVALQSHEQYEYIMFADQDDIWLPDKIEKTYLKMKEFEKSYSSFPLLVHSDIRVVDKKLNVLASSFWSYQHIDPKRDQLNYLLLHNIVTGCTVMINRALAEKVKTIPHEAIMHDWWMAMVASAFGKIGYIDEPLMLYRQHGTNDTGAKNYGWGYFIKKFRERPRLDRYLIQAEMFLSMYEDKLDDNSKGMLLVLKDFNSFSKFKKIQVIIKYKLWKNGFIRNIGLLVNT
ncbi:glycosyltransferase family 2 protein [Sulfurospirillum multivorans]|uniref:Rhamnosyltransferase n=2 Tax=Sulfurospirillum multivorans TaxID=66821 RepID=A0AA86ANJ1_SULMK|nr:glycosyltransferase family 2 protein [Sulfurospirillum multivorans]AHJ13779.1 putative rhamnosyltransferase [Sulfurospirillum multivorans DSM 12446]QEH07269.1 putative rhamnosyltransferase [Sulfurospirillum multivorans]